MQPEAQMNAMKEKPVDSEAVEPEPEPTTEVLFLCSYEGCGKTFIDAGALRKHSHVHGERQFVCHYENCGKVNLFLIFSLYHITYRHFNQILISLHGFLWLIHQTIETFNLFCRNFWIAQS